MNDYRPVKWSRYRRRWVRMPKIWQRLFYRHVERQVALFADDAKGPVAVIGPEQKEKP